MSAASQGDVCCRSHFTDVRLSLLRPRPRERSYGSGVWPGPDLRPGSAQVPEEAMAESHKIRFHVTRPLSSCGFECSQRLKSAIPMDCLGSVFLPELLPGTQRAVVRVLPHLHMVSIKGTFLFQVLNGCGARQGRSL